MGDAGKAQRGRTENQFFRNCIRTYNQIVKACVSPSERVPDQIIQGVLWSGTIEELRTKWWCDSGMAKTASNKGKNEAPLNRLEFGAEHNLIKSTNREYCGTPPPSAFH